MALSRDQLEAGAKRYKAKVRKVHVKGLADPETGDDVVYVRGLSTTEWDAHQAAIRVTDGNGQQIGIDESNFSARLAVRVIVDEQGNRLLQDTDATWLGEASPSDVAEVVNAAIELSGMTDQGANVSQEAKGNSDATQDGGTSSGSPESTEQPPLSSSDDSTLVAV